MLRYNPNLPLIELLQQLFPISGLMQIGAGQNFDLANLGLDNFPLAAFIEADEVRAEKLGGAIQERENWLVHNALIGPQDGDAAFYNASNSNESGLVCPDTLTPIWQNLATVSQDERPSITLATFLKQNEKYKYAERINWVHIDCLPALGILKGAKNFIDGLDVVLARTVLDESYVKNGESTGKPALDDFLSAHHFVPVSQFGERNSAIALVVYARNWKSEALVQVEDWSNKNETLTKARDEQNQFATERATQIEELTKARDEQNQFATERATQIEELTKARDEQNQLATKRAAQIEELTKARDEQNQLATKRAAQIEELTKARDEQNQLATERATQIEELTKARDEQNQLATKRAADRDVQRRLATQHKTKVAELNTLGEEKDKLIKCLRAEKEQLSEEQKSQNAGLQTKIDNLEKLLEIARRSEEQSEKRLQLRDADLGNLQQKYKKIAPDLEAKHEMLSELQQKLMTAAQYAKQIDKKKPAPARKRPVAKKASRVTKTKSRKSKKK